LADEKETGTADTGVPPKINSSLDEGDPESPFSFTISYAPHTIEPEPLNRAVTVMLSRPDSTLWLKILGATNSSPKLTNSIDSSPNWLEVEVASEQEIVNEEDDGAVQKLEQFTHSTTELESDKEDDDEDWGHLNTLQVSDPHW
jgi:hypothetical protein